MGEVVKGFFSRLKALNGEVLEHPLVEIAVTYAALLSVLIVVVELVYPLSDEAKFRLYLADLLVVTVLAIDFTHRARRSGAPMEYVKSNFYELPALIPVGLLALLESQLAGLGFLRLLRVLRLVRLAIVLARGSRFLGLASETAEKLKVAYLVGFAFVTLGFGSIAVYITESLHPQGQIRDLSTAFWWAIVTATTVGYGDIVPVTPLGKAVGVLMMLLGIASISMMVGIIGSMFLRALQLEEEPRGEVKGICEMLASLQDMDEEELRHMLALIEARWRSLRSGRASD